MIRLPLTPKNPDRVCWGCNTFCPADDMRCGNGTIRCPHPVELFGDGWLEEVPGVEGARVPGCEQSGRTEP